MIRVLLWFVAAMIIGTMTYLSALERRRDVAVLKAIGASTRQLGTSIALQGVLVALVAAVDRRRASRCLIVPGVPARGVGARRGRFIQVPVIAVLVALLAGDRRASARRCGVDPALAFAGPGS